MNKLFDLPMTRLAYSDRCAALLAEMSKIAYSSTVSTDLKNLGFDLINPYTCDKNENFSYLATNGKYAVLAFKGTVPSESQTVKTDLDFKFVKTNYGKFHEGFLTTFEEMQPQIEKDLAQLKMPIFITGHSLGGALALVATIFLKDQEYLSAAYTYGCPKIGNEQFANCLLKVPVYRIVHRADMVPSVPLWIMGYKSYGDLRYLSDDGKMCEGSEAVFKRLGASLNPLNFFSWIPDHSIDQYIRILKAYSESRNP
jgi:hypothetical protein